MQEDLWKIGWSVSLREWGLDRICWVWSCTWWTRTCSCNIWIGGQRWTDRNWSPNHRDSFGPAWKCLESIHRFWSAKWKPLKSKLTFWKAANENKTHKSLARLRMAYVRLSWFTWGLKTSLYESGFTFQGLRVVTKRRKTDAPWKLAWYGTESQLKFTINWRGKGEIPKAGKKAKKD